MQDIVKTYSHPRLNSPIMIAAWPGIADVAMIAAVQLIRTLKFKELAEIRAPYFFDPVGVIANNGIVQEPQFPQSNFYYWKNKNQGKILYFSSVRLSHPPVAMTWLT